MSVETKPSSSRRDKIADSAEKLFCTKGYYGVLYLASDESRQITGTSIVIYNGETMG